MGMHEKHAVEKPDRAVSATQRRNEVPDGQRLQRWRPRAWHYKDAAAIAGLPFQLAIPDWLPYRVWPDLARSLAWCRGARQPAWRRREVAYIAHYLNFADDVAARAHGELLA